MTACDVVFIEIYFKLPCFEENPDPPPPPTPASAPYVIYAPRSLERLGFSVISVMATFM